MANRLRTDSQILSAQHKKTPDIDVILVETNEPSGPFGAKGVGECGLVPTAAAVTNAIFNATDIRFNQIPVSEERMLLALKEREQK